jgi:hypothetical protein
VECGWHVRLSTLPTSVSPLSRQCAILNISQPYRPPRPVTGIALLCFTFIRVATFWLTSAQYWSALRADTVILRRTIRRHGREDCNRHIHLLGNITERENSHNATNFSGYLHVTSDLSYCFSTPLQECHNSAALDSSSSQCCKHARTNTDVLLSLNKCFSKSIYYLHRNSV